MAQRNIGYERFREALLNGTVRLGATLTQSDLCVILGMSLSPMRETMTLLQEEGLITVRKRAGVQVFHPDIEFFRANFQMRMLLEKEAVKRFARNASFEQLDELTQRHEACVADLRQAHDARDFIGRVAELESAFHLTIVSALANPVITEAHLRAFSNTRLFRLAHPVPYALETQSSALREHIEVLRRSRERDAAGAHDALDVHFRAVMNRTFGSE